MSMKLVYNLVSFTITFSTLVLTAQAQNQLTPDCNLMRDGDKIIKQQVVYKEPGREGKDVLWDFSRQECIEEHYQIRYYAYKDSFFVAQEQSTLYKYVCRKDSLFSCGFENRTTLIQNTSPELLWTFPCRYGDRHESYFHANGDYCDNLSLMTRGKSFTQADASGMMILPAGDTLRQVLRIHQNRQTIYRMVPHLLANHCDSVFNKDSIDYHLANDTARLQTDRYLWYAEGYRYPVFETVETTVFAHHKPCGSYKTAFFYTPQDQYYDLQTDPQNQAKRDKEQQRQIRLAQDRAKAENFKEGKDGKEQQESPLNYNLFKSEDNLTLKLEYCVKEQTEISIQLFDMQGRRLSGVHKSKQQRGIYTETISLEKFPAGEYMLRIVANGKTFGEKIVKR